MDHSVVLLMSSSHDKIEVELELALVVLLVLFAAVPSQDAAAVAPSPYSVNFAVKSVALSAAALVSSSTLTREVLPPLLVCFRDSGDGDEETKSPSCTMCTGEV